MISSAMVAVRGERAGKNATELLRMTMEANTTSQISGKMNNVVRYSANWDEHYLDNDLLNRFCSLKILDESLYHAHRAGIANPKMRDFLYAKVATLLPKSYGEAKSDVRGSLTDYLFVLSSSGSESLGGIRIGTLQGLGLALFGYAYPLVLLPFYIVIFYMLDSFCIQRKGKVFFSLVYFIGIINYTGLFSDKHFYTYEIRMIIRTFWETSIFYLISINIVKRLPIIRH